MRLKETKERYKKQLRGLPNVVGVGIGKKIVGGKDTGQSAIVVMVAKKKPLSKLRPEQIIPQNLEEWKTDVVETGEIWALQQSPTDRWRPAKPGVSIGHKDVTAGTFGAVIGTVNEPYILSNNHVLANSNNAEIGDPIYQPGVADGGSNIDTIGHLTAFVPIAMSASPCPIIGKVVDICNTILYKLGRVTRIRTYAPEPFAANEVDCAIAAPYDNYVIVPEILNIGKPEKETVKPVVGMEIQKSGRTTGYTKDKITAIDVTVTVNYLVGVATFEHQIMTGPMSAGGDSGSSVLDMQKHPVGLLFAGSEQVTIINEIDRVLEALGKEFI